MTKSIATTAKTQTRTVSNEVAELECQLALKRQALWLKPPESPKATPPKVSSSTPPASSTGLTSRSDPVSKSSDAPKTEATAVKIKSSSTETAKSNTSTNSPSTSESSNAPKTKVPVATVKPSSTETPQSNIDTNSPANRAPSSILQSVGSAAPSMQSAASSMLSAASSMLAAASSAYNSNAEYLAPYLQPALSSVARLPSEKIFGKTDPRFTYPQNANFSDYGQSMGQYQTPPNESGMYVQSGTEMGRWMRIASEYGQMPDRKVSFSQLSMQDQVGSRKLSN
jgi:hypothetical protein